jgi:hypothetical protein
MLTTYLLLLLMILLLLMLMILLLLLLSDSSCLLFNLQILSSYVWKLCVRFEGSGAAGGAGGGGGRGNACPENTPCWTRKRTWFVWRNKHTYWLTSPSPPAFYYLRFLVPTYLPRAPT